MGFLDKAMSMAEQATTKAKEGVEDVQTKRGLGQAYTELGKAAFDLIEGGELSHPGLEEAAAKIRELRAKADDADGDGGGEGPDAGPATEPSKEHTTSA
jgi:hypothetical protein